MIKKIFFIFLFTSYSLVFSQENSSRQDKNINDYAILFRIDNDKFAGSDDYYTNGLYLGFVASSTSFERSIFPDFIGRALQYLPGLNPDGRVVNSGFSIAQRMFTPHDIENVSFNEDDLPFSGQICFNLSASTQNSRHFDAWTLTLGATGPISGAGKLQRQVHQALFPSEADGWESQLKDELLINLFNQHRFRIFELGKTTRYFDTMLIGSGGIGNLISFAEGGVCIRLGWNIPNDFLAPDSIFTDPMLGIMPTTPTKSKFSCYLFGGISGSFTAYNIALDGNSFPADGPSVDYLHYGYRINAGLALELKRFQVIFNLSYVDVPWENPYNIKSDKYGQLSLVYRF